MAKVFIGVGIFVILMGIAVGVLIYQFGPKDSGAEARSALVTILSSGPGVVMAIWGGILNHKSKKKK